MESFPFDRASKWLIAHHGDAVLRMAGVSGITGWRAVQPEVVQPRQLPDGLIEIQRAGIDRPDLFVVEIATDPEARIAEQVFADLALVYLSRRVLPEAVVVVLRPKGRSRAPTRFGIQSRLGWSRLRAGWRVVNLWQVSAADLLATGDAGLAPWATVARWDGPPEVLLRQCREIIDRGAPPDERPNMLGVAVKLAEIRYHDHPELLALLGGKQAVIDSPLIREIVADEIRDAILSELKDRWGDVPADISAGLRAVGDQKQLMRVLRLLAPMRDPDTFRRDLAALAVTPP